MNLIKNGQHITENLLNSEQIQSISVQIQQFPHQISPFRSDKMANFHSKINANVLNCILHVRKLVERVRNIQKNAVGGDGSNNQCGKTHLACHPN